MNVRRITAIPLATCAFSALLALGGCGTSGSDHSSGNSATGGAGGMTNVIAGELPIIVAAGADVPYQFGDNPYGVTGGAFLAKAPMGSDTVVLDTTQSGKICLSGMVEAVPTPADGTTTQPFRVIPGQGQPSTMPSPTTQPSPHCS